MPGSTARRGLPYMVDTDPMADVAQSIEDLALALDKTIRGTATITLAASASGSVAVTFPAGLFSAAPIVTATVIRAAHFYIVSADSITSSGMTLRVQHANSTSFSTSVVVHWTAGPATA